MLGLDLGAYRLFLIAIVVVRDARAAPGCSSARASARRCERRSTTAARRPGSASTSSRVFALTFALGSGLAGLGGGLGIDVLGLDPTFPLKYMVYFLLVVAIGGAGTIKGPLVAALILGVFDVAGKYYVPQIGSFIIYVPDGRADDPVSRGPLRADVSERRPARSPCGGAPRLAGRPVAIRRRSRSGCSPVAAFFVFPNYRVLGSQILITGLFARVARSHPRLRRHRLAGSRGVLRRRRLYGGDARRARLGRAVERARSSPRRSRLLSPASSPAFSSCADRI